MSSRNWLIENRIGRGNRGRRRATRFCNFYKVSTVLRPQLHRKHQEARNAARTVKKRERQEALKDVRVEIDSIAEARYFERAYLSIPWRKGCEGSYRAQGARFVLWLDHGLDSHERADLDYFREQYDEEMRDGDWWQDDEPGAEYWREEDEAEAAYWEERSEREYWAAIDAEEAARQARLRDKTSRDWLDAWIDNSSEIEDDDNQFKSWWEQCDVWEAEFAEYQRSLEDEIQYYDDPYGRYYELNLQIDQISSLQFNNTETPAQREQRRLKRKAGERFFRQNGRTQDLSFPARSSEDTQKERSSYLGGGIWRFCKSEGS